MRPVIRIFADLRDNDKAIKLAKEVTTLRHFTDKLKFQPIIDYPTYFNSAKEVIKVDDGYLLKPVSAHVKSNYRQSRTRIPDSVIAGIFFEIITREAPEVFKKVWADYIEDYVVRTTVGDPVIILELIKGVAMEDFDPPPIPDLDRITALRLITLWDEDLKNHDCWCMSPRKFPMHNDRHLHSAFLDAIELKNPSANRIFNLNRNWSVADCKRAMLWCIASGTHPLRLLNFVGYYMTHKDSQPLSFSKQNPKTQLGEVELRNKLREIVGYETAKPQFSAGFIVEFANLCRSVTWFDEKGQLDEILHADFIEYAHCFVMEDFFSIGGLVWQPLPLTKQGRDYYTDAALTEVNPNTVRELSTEQESRRSIRNQMNRENLKSKTGNPLFDLEMLKDDEEED